MLEHLLLLRSCWGTSKTQARQGNSTPGDAIIGMLFNSVALAAIIIWMLAYYVSMHDISNLLKAIHYV